MPNLSAIAISQLTFSLQQYCGSCILLLPSQEVFDSIKTLDEIIVTVKNIDIYFIVTKKNRSDSVSAEQFSIECKSPSVLLDAPYADTIEEFPTFNMNASTLVDTLAQLENQHVVWDIPADCYITDQMLTVTEQTPLSAIRTIVNDFKGVLQTFADGTLHAIPKRAINSNEYNTTAATTNIDNVISYEDTEEFSPEYNKFLITDATTDESYRLETVNVSPTEYTVKAFVMPWNNAAFNLTTSELTNVWIGAGTVITEYIEEEEIEIKSGTGSTQYPCYGIGAINYETSSNLGNINFIEDGTITTDTYGNTLVKLSYYTKYWQWTVTDTDDEKVQLILEKA